MKLEVFETKTITTKEVVSFIEIETPYFLKYGRFCFKISDERFVRIYDNETEYTIFSRLNNEDDLLYYIEHGQKISESEFNEAYSKALNLIEETVKEKEEAA